MNTSGTFICEKIENDEFYRGFLNESQHVDVNKFFSYTDQINKLSDGLEILLAELQSQVRSQHGALLSQASHAGRLDNALDSIHGQMEQLVNGAERLKIQINTPYNSLKTQTKVLGRLHEVSHFLRQSAIFLQLFKKLQMVTELKKQANILYQIESLTQDETLNQIQFLKIEINFVLTSRQKLVNIADKELINGLKDKKVANVMNSLEIFSNLQILPKYIDDILDTFLTDIKQSIKECFTAPETKTSNRQIENKMNASKGPGKTPSLTTSLHFRTKFWMAIEWLFLEEIYSYTEQILLLQKCINNNALLWEDINIDLKWWKGLQDLLKKSFMDCSPHIHQCLQQDLPKLVAATNELHRKLQINSAFDENIYQSLETGFMEKCGNALKASINGVDFITEDTIDSFIRVALNELGPAIVDKRLSDVVIQVIMSCNKDIWNKLKSNIKLGTDSQQIFDIPNASQIQNTLIANLIYYHNEAINRMVTNIGANLSQSKSGESLLKDLSIGSDLETTIIRQLINSISSAVHDILLSMHREPGLNTNMTSIPSLYIKELQDFLNRVWHTHITTFKNKKIILQCGKELATRCIELFVRNVAILRPLTTIGRNKIKIDCQQLETILKQIVIELFILGRPYRLLRAFQTIVTLSADELSKQSVEVDSSVSPHIILFMLFSYAGNDLSSPHIIAGWTNDKLIHWLDNHTFERDRLELIAGALQKYRNIIRQKNIAQYDPIYPLISSFLEKAIAKY